MAGQQLRLGAGGAWERFGPGSQNQVVVYDQNGLPTAAAIPSHASTHAIDGADPVIPYQIYMKDEPLLLVGSSPLILDSSHMLFLDAQLPAYLPVAYYQLPTDMMIIQGAQTRLVGDPLILGNALLDLGGNADSVLWLDAANMPQQTSGPLYLGVS